MGIVNGNCRVEIYIHLLDLTRNRSEKCNFRSLAGIEPTALRFCRFNSFPVQFLKPAGSIPFRSNSLNQQVQFLPGTYKVAFSLLFLVRSNINVYKCPPDNFHLQYPSNTIHSSEMSTKSLIGVYIP
jgi:hypothetical protein